MPTIVVANPAWWWSAGKGDCPWRPEGLNTSIGKIAQTPSTGTLLNDDIKSWLKSQFTRTDAVLELGCGTGTFSEAVAPFVKDLIATDMSEGMLQQARAKLRRHSNVRLVRLQKEDAYKTTFDESAFDAVLMVNLLHIVHDPER